MRARCRVCWRSCALTRHGLAWFHTAQGYGERGRRCPGAGAPPLGSPGPELDPLPGQVVDRSALTGEGGWQGTVYLLHLDPPFQHARHYLGWASPGNLAHRLHHHASGSGANLLLHAAKAGCSWTLARTWSGDRHLERRLKRRGGAARVCPTCRPELLARVLTDHPPE